MSLNTFIQFKDIDEMCRESDEHIAWVKEYIDICIDWICSAEHRGYMSQSQVITMQ